MVFLTSFRKTAAPKKEKKEDLRLLRGAGAVGALGGSAAATYGMLNSSIGHEKALHHARGAIAQVAAHGHDLLRAKGSPIYQKHRELARQGARQMIRGKRQFKGGLAAYLAGVGALSYAGHRSRKKNKK